MVRRADAPPPGWYPDPTGRRGLLWWDGLDWSRHRRPLPAGFDTRAATDEGPSPDPERSGASGSVPTATQLRSRADRERRRRNEQEVAEAVAEARRVARSEVEKAVREATSRVTSVRDQWQPRLDEYRRRAKRWLRLVVVVVVVFVALSTWASATMQTSLLEWLGERIDAATE